MKIEWGPRPTPEQVRAHAEKYGIGKVMGMACTFAWWLCKRDDPTYPPRTVGLGAFGKHDPSVVTQYGAGPPYEQHWLPLDRDGLPIVYED